MYATMPPPNVPALVSYMAGDYTPRIEPIPRDEVWTLSPRSDAKIAIKVETRYRHSARYYRWHSDGILSDLGDTLSDLL